MYNGSDNLTIKYWAEEDRPREKLLLKGKESLSDAELLAIIIGSGNRTLSAVSLCQQILASCKNDLALLSKKSIVDLMSFSGIGEAKAISIVAALELGKRKQYLPAKDIIQIKCSNDIFMVMYPLLSDLYFEEFWIITLNKNNRIIRKIKLSSGGISGTVVDYKMIFNYAFQDAASSMILVHNHPSGNIEPSEPDKIITKNIVSAAKLLEITILDHLIVAGEKYFSFADEGIINI